MAGNPRHSYFLTIVTILLVLTASGCGKNYKAPQSSGTYPFLQRTDTETQKNLTVTVAVPSPKETKQIFGYPLEKKEIQPVWIKVVNNEKRSYNLLPTSVDREYYSPNEVAYKTRLGFNKKGQRKREIFFADKDFDYYIPAGGTSSGFIFTRVDEGLKMVSVALVTEQDYRIFNFIVRVPGITPDHTLVDFDNLYKPHEYKTVDLEGLRSYLEGLPCCTHSKKKTDPIGDPMNFVIVGDSEELRSAFVRSGWKETEAGKGKTMKTLAAYLNKRPYHYAPMSDLYYFGRKQDLSLQKPRKTPHERNHLRMWLTPYKFKSKDVWIGAISRDIGIRWTVKSSYLFMTHKIDSDMDETRQYLTEDLFETRAIERLGYVKGVGLISVKSPRKNHMGDFWFTDGLRSIIFLSEQPTQFDEIDFLEWETPPRAYGKEAIP